MGEASYHFVVVVVAEPRDSTASFAALLQKHPSLRLILTESKTRGIDLLVSLFPIALWQFNHVGSFSLWEVHGQVDGAADIPDDKIVVLIC